MLVTEVLKKNTTVMGGGGGGGGGGGKCLPLPPLATPLIHSLLVSHYRVSHQCSTTIGSDATFL